MMLKEVILCSYELPWTQVQYAMRRISGWLMALVLQVAL